PARPTRAFVPITMDEARDALRETSNTTAPGESGSTYRLMKWAFDTTPYIFIDFFNACMRFGTHPRALKRAVIAVIAKPRKIDMSNPRSYRPIALLECLSKWLEKINAARFMF
ncbi:hypothetical protein K523DRAFT_220728, partial [Schizophyllum commune Tattone D]